MGTLDSNLDIQDGDYSSDEEVVDDEVTEEEIEDSSIKASKSDESVDDVARRKKVRRLLELQLERRRLRKEIDFYSDYENDEDLEDKE